MMLGIQHAEREEVFHVHCVCRGGGGGGTDMSQTDLHVSGHALGCRARRN